MRPNSPHPGNTPRVRLVDATLSETLRAPAKALGRDAIRALCSALPLPGIAAAAPFYPEGAYGWDLLVPAAARAVMLEPLTPDAHRNVARLLQEHAPDPKDPETRPLPLPLTGRAGQAVRVLVDPTSVPLVEADADPDDPSQELPPGWVRERVVTLPPPAPLSPMDDTENTQPLPTRTGHAGVLGKASLLIARMPRSERLRIRDPYGTITPELAGRLAGLVDAPRLTLHLENPDGLGPATARAALASPRGPLVRTAVVGIGPRTGLPPTELFQPPTHEDTGEQAFQQAVDALQRHAGFIVPSNHPYWGKNRHFTGEAEHLGEAGAEVCTNPATLGAILDHHLAEWQLSLTRGQRARIHGRLLAQVRPGEPLTGPVLWALVAQEVDLEAHVGKGTKKEK